MFYTDYGCDNVFDVPHTERSMLLTSISVKRRSVINQRFAMRNSHTNQEPI